MAMVSFLGGLLFTGGLFWAVMQGLSRISGWQQVARQYPANRPPGGIKFSVQSAALWWVSYNNCLTIYRDDYGLHIYPWLPFRIGHPPLLIPWTEMHRPVESRFLGMRFISVDVGSPRLTRLQVSAKVFMPSRPK